MAPLGQLRIPGHRWLSIRVNSLQTTVRRGFRTLHAAGHAGAGFHDLRRANATALVSQGIDIKTVQSRLGHSDPRLTLQVYAEVVQEAEHHAADVLGKHFVTIQGP